jgi:hypothetical protein
LGLHHNAFSDLFLLFLAFKACQTFSFYQFFAFIGAYPASLLIYEQVMSILDAFNQFTVVLLKSSFNCKVISLEIQLFLQVSKVIYVLKVGVP